MDTKMPAWKARIVVYGSLLFVAFLLYLFAFMPTILVITAIVIIVVYCLVLIGMLCETWVKHLQGKQ